MKRYMDMHLGEFTEHKQGEWVKCSEAEGLIDELYGTINRNSSKIIKLTSQNKKMLEFLKKIANMPERPETYINIHSLARQTIQEVEKGEE